VDSFRVKPTQRVAPAMTRAAVAASSAATLVFNLDFGLARLRIWWRVLIGKSKGEWAGLSARRHAVVSVNVVDGCGN